MINLYKSLRKINLSLLIIILFSLLIIAGTGRVLGAADFDVNTFQCTPSEVLINNVFSCTVQVKNNGDAAGSVNELRLYPDSNSWLESTNYLQSSGTSVSPGQTFEVTFFGLRAIKAGNNGFSRISLDNEDDTYPADNNVKVNVIDISLTLSNSASSTGMGNNFTSAGEVTAGGNIDATLTLTIDSGGCTIGNQASQKSTTGLANNQKWNPSAWTITEGTTGNCKFTISASATGANGVATKTSSLTSTVTCTDCSTTSSSSSSSAGSGGGGGGGTLIASLGELRESLTKELGINEKVSFTFGSINHSLLVTNVTETTAVIEVRSAVQIFTLTVGDTKEVDFESDGKKDISIKLKSVNLITKKAIFIISPLYAAEIPAGAGAGQEKNETGKENEKNKEIFNLTPETKEKLKKSAKIAGIIILILIVLLGIASYFGWIHLKWLNFRRSVILKKFTPSDY